MVTPGFLVRVEPVAGRTGEGAPLGLAVPGTGVLDTQAVDGHAVLIETGLISAHAVLVHGQAGEDLLEGSAVSGVPGPAGQVGLGQTRLSEHVPVVEDRHGVPVLGAAVLVSVLPLPQVDEALLEGGLIDARPGGLLLQWNQDLQVHELGELGDVVGEGVRAGPGDEAGRQLGPVVTPGDLGDVDLDAGLGLEGLGAGLIGGQLAGVPHPVLDGAGSRLPGAAGAGGQGQGGRA